MLIGKLISGQVKHYYIIYIVVFFYCLAEALRVATSGLFIIFGYISLSNKRLSDSLLSALKLIYDIAALVSLVVVGVLCVRVLFACVLLSHV